MNILVVDDDKELLAAVERILTRNGHSVDCSDNAAAAVKMAAANRYDFVLVDYRIPEHNGIWFLQNASLPRSTRALLMTAFTDGNVIGRMFGVGISGYIAKPFDETELLRHIDFHSVNRDPRLDAESMEAQQ